MVKRKLVLERGDVVWISFNPVAGHEQSGRRPALVISPRIYNALSGLVLCCPITSKKKGYPFEVDIKDSKIDGVVISDQLRSIDWQARKVKLHSRASADIVNDVLAKINVLVS